ncbi:Angiogenic factor with G patch and FHA domains 1 [Lobosporangium transversale]|nr:Angiogenic factor with G patch and FHA domains 1 [Lobosporangium transversale]
MDASGLSFGRDRPLSGQGNRVRMVEMEISRFHASIYLDRQQVHPHQQSDGQGQLEQRQHHRQQYQHQQQSQKKQYDEVENEQYTPQTQGSMKHKSLPPAADTPNKPSQSDMSTEVATQKNEDGAVNDNSSSAFLSETEAILKVEASTSGTNEGSHSNAEVRSGEQRQQDNDDGENNDDGREDGELPESPSAGARDTGLENYRGENKGREMEGELEEGEEYDEPAQMVQSQGLEQQYKDYQQQLEKYQQYYETMLTATTAAMASLDYIDTFQITDCGSTHGTFLNGERLSVPKAASQPFALKHMDQLRMGSTVFEVHLHEDGRICETCQITDGNEIEVMSDKGHWEGSTIPAEKNSPSLVGDLRLTREQERIEEMNRLKKKWAGPDRKTYFNSKRGGEVSGDGDEGSQGASQYVDRAAKRRLYNPDRSSPIPSVIPVYASQQQQQHQEMAAQTSGFHVPVAHTNKGHAMLSKMGWKAGTGLGVAGQGVVEPIQLMVTDRKAGLGSKALQTQGDAASRTPETPGEQARRKARERYAQLK